MRASIKSLRVRASLSTLALLVLAALTLPAVASALPEGRHYEMVSPPYKAGYGVIRLDATAMQGEREGEAVVFESEGNFAGQPLGSPVGPYLARRGASGWSTGPLFPPVAVGGSGAGIVDISPTLQGLYESEGGRNQEAAFLESEPMLMLHDLLAPDTKAGFYTPLTEPSFGLPLTVLDGKKDDVRIVGADPGFCHVLISVGGTNVAPVLVPEARGVYAPLYEIVTGAPGCGGEPALRLVTVSNTLKSNGEHVAIDPPCYAVTGSTGGDNFNAVAGGGSEIFFSDGVRPEACNGAANLRVLYLRLNGEKTVLVSAPLAANCVSGPCTSAVQQPAEFAGADEAGSRVFFTTAEPLVTGDVDTGNDLYMANIGCPVAEPGCEPGKREVTSLVQVSHAPSGEAAEVQGVSALSPDGGRMYFVAHGVLTGADGEGRMPVSGAENLYVYDSQEAKTRFIADLSVRDADDWGNVPEVQTTGDGSFLVFTSYVQLITSGAQADRDAARDVYRYDAQSETLDRVSLGEEGYDTNGNDSAFNSEIPQHDTSTLTDAEELGDRAISEDGSRIVFETAGPLSSAATNGLTNAYEWHKEAAWSEGRVALVSTGSDEAPVGEAHEGTAGRIMITPSGRDIFFMTVQGLSAKDVDGAFDVYDARLGSGFPAEAAQRRPCEGDACQGPLTNPAPLLVPGSVSQAPGENLAPPALTKPTTKSKTVSCKQGFAKKKNKCVKAKKSSKKSKKASKSTRGGKS